MKKTTTNMMKMMKWKLKMVLVVSCQLLPHCDH